MTLSNSFIARCRALAYSGLIPKLVDVGEDLNIDIKLLQKKITKKLSLSPGVVVVNC